MRLIFVMALALLVGCGQSNQQEALTYAVSACEIGKPSGEPLPSGVIPTDDQLSSWEQVPDDAADSAAAAATLDVTWRDLAEAFSFYADSSAEVADLWRRVKSVPTDGLSFPSAQAEIQYRFGQTGTPYEKALAIDRDLSVSAKEIRGDCRRVTALDR